MRPTPRLPRHPAPSRSLLRPLLQPARALAVLAAVGLATLGAGSHAATPAPPPTPSEPVTDVYHGTTVVDPYRWMEDMKSPAFQAWLKAQAAHAGAVLATLPGRAALRQRLGALADASVNVGEVSVSPGGRTFYLKRLPGEASRKLWMREGLDGPERLLLDPEALPGRPGRHAIDWTSPSPDGRLVALGLSLGGSEDSVLHVIDVASGRLLGERIDRTGLNEPGVAWLPGNRGFFYNRHPADERYNQSTVWRHTLGRPDGEDVPVFGWGADPARRFERPDLPYLSTVGGSSWAMAEVLHGDAAERSYWLAPVAALRGPAPARAGWRRLLGPEDKVTQAVLVGRTVYAVSQRNASRRELWAIDVASGRRQVVLPAGDQVLQTAVVGRDGVYLKALDGGVSRLWRVPLRHRASGAPAGPAAPVALPFEGSLRELAPLPRGGVLVRLEGWTRAPQVFALRDGRSEALGLQPPSTVDASGVESRRVMVRAADGTAVPMSLLLPRGLTAEQARRDGGRPTVVTGYGAYGISLEPRFSPTRLAWIERGGLAAVCHVRGGGELGEDWHRGGYIETKQNTIGDFIACAEWLVDQGWASPRTLAGTGGSAGGITIGGAITQRPELFAAAQSAVGVSDMLRMELTPNGAPNIAEFGTVTNPAHFRAMFAISPYHRIRDGVAYPAVIVTTGANDPRVDAWMPGKLAARLQAANPNGKPVLLRVDFDGGHGMGSSVTQQLDETADVWSFFLWQMGDPAFQPKASAP
ncbi:prolyl oligopeptidase family serine peptidase [Piscinibacter sakaiensis]|uniref:prolyl oligopeptidase n=2 Tax=Piscinibacter sakaiensis TaxID=1547922 RepID=A0A0K8NZX3_PISS1|nr:prolyl oligopeptidase family serine peptidase [Piscinibacter sakaiensis]GAP35928.1 prolyl endopeptidase [Piscinibacter sakaiensis]